MHILVADKAVFHCENSNIFLQSLYFFYEIIPNFFLQGRLRASYFSFLKL